VVNQLHADASTNQHQRMAAIYLAATSLTALRASTCALEGLYGAAAALLISELAMNCYVLLRRCASRTTRFRVHGQSDALSAITEAWVLLAQLRRGSGSSSGE